MLKKMPWCGIAYENGHINSSSLRTLLKVATPETQAEWIEKARRLTVRGFEDEVSDVLKKRDDGVASKFASDDDGFSSAAGMMSRCAGDRMLR